MFKSLISKISDAAATISGPTFTDTNREWADVISHGGVFDEATNTNCRKSEKSTPQAVTAGWIGDWDPRVSYRLAAASAAPLPCARLIAYDTVRQLLIVLADAPHLPFGAPVVPPVVSQAIAGACVHVLGGGDGLPLRRAIPVPEHVDWLEMHLAEGTHTLQLLARDRLCVVDLSSTTTAVADEMKAGFVFADRGRDVPQARVLLRPGAQAAYQFVKLGTELPVGLSFAAVGTSDARVLFAPLQSADPVHPPQWCTFEASVGSMLDTAGIQALKASRDQSRAHFAGASADWDRTTYIGAYPSDPNAFIVATRSSHGVAKIYLLEDRLSAMFLLPHVPEAKASPTDVLGSFIVAATVSAGGGSVIGLTNLLTIVLWCEQGGKTPDRSVPPSLVAHLLHSPTASVPLQALQAQANECLLSLPHMHAFTPVTLEEYSERTTSCTLTEVPPCGEPAKPANPSARAAPDAIAIVVPAVVLVGSPTGPRRHRTDFFEAVINTKTKSVDCVRRLEGACIMEAALPVSIAPPAPKASLGHPWPAHPFSLCTAALVPNGIWPTERTIGILPSGAASGSSALFACATTMTTESRESAYVRERRVYIVKQLRTPLFGGVCLVDRHVCGGIVGLSGGPLGCLRGGGGAGPVRVVRSQNRRLLFDTVTSVERHMQQTLVTRSSASRLLRGGHNNPFVQRMGPQQTNQVRSGRTKPYYSKNTDDVGFLMFSGGDATTLCRVYPHSDAASPSPEGTSLARMTTVESTGHAISGAMREVIAREVLLRGALVLTLVEELVPAADAEAHYHVRYLLQSFTQRPLHADEDSDADASDFEEPITQRTAPAAGLVSSQNEAAFVGQLPLPYTEHLLPACATFLPSMIAPDGAVAAAAPRVTFMRTVAGSCVFNGASSSVFCPNDGVSLLVVMTDNTCILTPISALVPSKSGGNNERSVHVPAFLFPAQTRICAVDTFSAPVCSANASMASSVLVLVAGLSDGSVFFFDLCRSVVLGCRRLIEGSSVVSLLCATPSNGAYSYTPPHTPSRPEDAAFVPQPVSQPSILHESVYNPLSIPCYSTDGTRACALYSWFHAGALGLAPPAIPASSQLQDRTKPGSASYIKMEVRFNAGMTTLGDVAGAASTGVTDAWLPLLRVMLVDLFGFPLCGLELAQKAAEGGGVVFGVRVCDTDMIPGADDGEWAAVPSDLLANTGGLSLTRCLDSGIASVSSVVSDAGSAVPAPLITRKMSPPAGVMLLNARRVSSINVHCGPGSPFYMNQKGTNIDIEIVDGYEDRVRLFGVCPAAVPQGPSAQHWPSLHAFPPSRGASPSASSSLPDRMAKTLSASYPVAFVMTRQQVRGHSSGDSHCDVVMHTLHLGAMIGALQQGIAAAGGPPSSPKERGFTAAAVSLRRLLSVAVRHNNMSVEGIGAFQDGSASPKARPGASQGKQLSFDERMRRIERGLPVPSQSTATEKDKSRERPSIDQTIAATGDPKRSSPYSHFYLPSVESAFFCLSTSSEHHDPDELIGVRLSATEDADNADECKLIDHVPFDRQRPLAVVVFTTSTSTRNPYCDTIVDAEEGLYGDAQLLDGGEGDSGPPRGCIRQGGAFRTNIALFDVSVSAGMSREGNPLAPMAVLAVPLSVVPASHAVRGLDVCWVGGQLHVFLLTSASENSVIHTAHVVLDDGSGDLEEPSSSDSDDSAEEEKKKSKSTKKAKKGMIRVTPPTRLCWVDAGGRDWNSFSACNYVGLRQDVRFQTESALLADFRSTLSKSGKTTTSYIGTRVPAPPSNLSATQREQGLLKRLITTSYADQLVKVEKKVLSEVRTTDFDDFFGAVESSTMSKLSPEEKRRMLLQSRYSTGGPNAGAGGVKGDINDTKNIMNENMRLLNERGEKIERLELKTAELHEEAATFADLAAQLKKKQRNRWF